MFTYFGSKSKLARYYPRPKYKLIFEPFCGSARYALHWSEDHDIWINDIDRQIFAIWRWIQEATRKDIEALPELERGDDLSKIQWLSDVERDLVGRCAGISQVRARNTPSRWVVGRNCFRKLKLSLLQHLDNIRGWTITNLDYFDLPDLTATWFIDAPYQVQGVAYVHNDIDFQALGAWCQSRCGQTIVCEELGATWLPFGTFRRVRTIRRWMTEAIWTQG